MADNQVAAITRSCARVIAAAFAAAMLSSCTADAPEAAPSWTAPAWFAEQAQEREAFTVKLQACIERLGWDVKVDEYGGSDTPFNEEDLARFEKDSTQCQEENGRSLSARTEPQIRSDYAKDLDTWACLRAEGLDLEDPPTEDEYVESRLADAPDAWLPYGDPAVAGAVESGNMTDQELMELERKCPQNWA